MDGWQRFSFLYQQTVWAGNLFPQAANGLIGSHIAASEFVDVVVKPLDEIFFGFQIIQFCDDGAGINYISVSFFFTSQRDAALNIHCVSPGQAVVQAKVIYGFRYLMAIETALAG